MDSLIAQTSRKWDQIKNSKSPRLLKLSLLRDFTRSLHTAKSEYLSTGRADLAAELGGMESSLNELFPDLPISALSFDQVIEEIRRRPAARASGKAPAQAVLELPEGLLSVLGSSKFTRQDRAWERALAEEASRQGWSFWQMEASVDIHQVEAWARQFSETIWPNGIVLFIESDGFLQTGGQTGGRTRKETPDVAFWRGKWTLLLDRQIPGPDELGIDVSRLPGSPSQSPGLRWKLLFSGKTV